MADRTGKRKKRSELSKRRIPELGYYFIVTDTKETEQNYLLGLRDSIPKELQGKLVIKVFKANTIELVDEALSLASLQPQYGEPWVVFDRDSVKEFDKIVDFAQRKGINVGWSNPCFETWLHAHFGTMPKCSDSASCCVAFGETFSNKTGQEYKKADKDIYVKLCSSGNEAEAFKIAKQKLREHKLAGKTKPSEMNPATMVHVLIEEIKGKVERFANE